jgi:hypothetical protein
MWGFVKMIKSGNHETTVPNKNDIGPTTAIIDLVPPLADQDLLNHRHRILKQVLPALFQPAQSLA